MKKIALVLAASVVFSAPLGAAAQVVAAEPASAAGPAADWCPCTDFRFTAKTEKAKAVAEFFEARSDYKVAAGIGGMAVLFSMMSRSSEGINEAQRALGDATDKLLRARDRAAKLHGLTVSGDDPKASVFVTLKKGEDYVMSDAR
jgi:hypothetical protein